VELQYLDSVDLHYSWHGLFLFTSLGYIQNVQDGIEVPLRCKHETNISHHMNVCEVVKLYKFGDSDHQKKKVNSMSTHVELRLASSFIIP
jgi:hypothetical protein